MVQQNHGEMLENHGYLLWDVPTRTFTEHHIHNDYGFLTIDVVDGKIPQWVYDEVNTKLPKHPRLRLRFTSTEASDMKLRITELKKMFNVDEVTVTRTDTIGQLKTNTKINKNIVGNVKDETFQNSLIKDYLERQYLLTNDELDKIGEINKELNSKVNHEDLAENIIWYPKTLEFSNMFSYGEGNLVRFERANGIVGLFAPNASGKSSLFDALAFCIFDKTSRTSIAKNILNNRKEHFYCKFNFEVDGVDYFIERRAKYVRKGNAVKVDVDFWKEDGGVTESLNGEQRKDTNRNIERYLGKFDDFVLTSLSLQGNNALFIDKSQSERKEILSQFIGVDIFDKLYTLASDENRENSTLIKKFKNDDFTTKLADIETKLRADKTQFKLAQIEQSSLKDTEDGYNKELIRLNGKIVKLNADSGVSIDELESKLVSLEKKHADLLEEKKTIQSKIDEREVQQLEIESLIDRFDEEELEVKNKELVFTKKHKDDLSIIVEKNEIKLDSLIDRKEHLDSHKYNEQCDICMENSQSIREQKEKVNSEIKTTKESIDELNFQIQTLESQIADLLKYETDWNNLVELKDKENKLDKDISSLINKLSTT